MNIDAIDKDLSFAGFCGTIQHGHQGGFSRTAGAHDAHHSSRLRTETYIIQPFDSILKLIADMLRLKYDF